MGRTSSRSKILPLDLSSRFADERIPDRLTSISSSLLWSLFLNDLFSLEGDLWAEPVSSYMSSQVVRSMQAPRKYCKNKISYDTFNETFSISQGSGAEPFFDLFLLPLESICEATRKNFLVSLV